MERDLDRFIEKDTIDYVVEGCDLFEIINFNEPMVLEAMRSTYAEDADLCRCPICVEDLFALALNALPPRYIQPTSLRTYEGSHSFNDREAVAAAVCEASAKVKASPKH